MLVGEPLTSDEVQHQRLGKFKALAVFSSDALSSVAYATEAILIELSSAQNASLAFPWMWPITLCIVGLLVVLIFSYLQTISAYPGGGGAYTVCKENLGEYVGLVAAASLIIDYILTVAVSIAAGTAAVTAAVPSLSPHSVLISCTAIFILMVMNLRGIRESGTVFSIPTYMFIFSMFGLFIWLGFIGSSSPQITSTNLMPSSSSHIGLWLILVAFANGCTALTGVEAVSNGVTAFKQPEQKNAQKTLVWMGVILGGMFIGVSYYSHIFGIVPVEGDTLVSQLARLLHNDFFYYLIQASTAGILFLAANTSFNDFPRVSSLLAEDRYMPRQLASRGDRLVFSNGIIGLGLTAMFLIWVFNSNVQLLLPMYAIGVFLCFSLSQAGMVKHWVLLKDSPTWFAKAIINGLGCVTTTIALGVIVITKFPHGGWIVCGLIPLIVLTFRRIKFHYLIVANQLRLVGPPLKAQNISRHKVIIPVSGIHRGVIDALLYARSLSNEVTACYVDINPRATARIVQEWERYGMKIRLQILTSPYRSILKPLIDYVEKELVQDSSGLITIIIPEFVTAKWWHQILHNQTAIFIRAALAFKRRVVVTTVRYHLTK